MTTFYLDTETFNEEDISNGLYKYAQSPSLEVLLLTYATGNDKPKLWDITSGAVMPAEVEDALLDPRTQKVAHNAQFDREVIAAGLGIDVPIEQWRCTMAKALAHGLPGNLADLGKVLGLPEDQQKLKFGKKFIEKFCKPAPASQLVWKQVPKAVMALMPDLPWVAVSKGREQNLEIFQSIPESELRERGIRWRIGRNSLETMPDVWEAGCEYALQDITAMRECDKRIPNWNFPGSGEKNTPVALDELRLWHLDQRINKRGFAVDTELASAGKLATEQGKVRMKQQCVDLTHGLVEGTSKRADLLAHLNTYYQLGIADTKKETFEELLKHAKASGVALHPTAKALMELSINANKSSTAKYGTMLDAVGADGRFRGGLQFNGASRTRRWAGRIFQPQNLPSRIDGWVKALIQDYIDSLKAGLADIFFSSDEASTIASAALRSLVTSPKGKVLRVSDLSNIEGRLAAWLADAMWKLEAFAAYDAGTGPDLYRVAAGMMTGQDPYEVSSTLRNKLGKPSELGLAYQGGVDALRRMLGTDQMYAHWDAIKEAVASEFVEQAEINYDTWGESRTELAREEWVACETVKIAWRKKNPEIVKLWYAIEKAMADAVETPNVWFAAGSKLKYASTTYAGHSWLLCKLPSGRHICYFHPQVKRTIDSDTNRTKRTVSYEGYDSTDNKKVWARRGLHGGLAFGNACQTIAGDILKAPLERIDNVMSVVLTVHDEIIAEDDISADGMARLQWLEKEMTNVPAWADGLPLSAGGFNTYVYGKDPEMHTVHHGDQLTFGANSISTLEAIELLAADDYGNALNQFNQYRLGLVACRQDLLASKPKGWEKSLVTLNTVDGYLDVTEKRLIGAGYA